MKAHYFWPARRFDELSREEIDTLPVKNGCTYQGRFEGQPEPAECCTTVGADGQPDVWESADGEVLSVFIGALVAFVSFCALIGMLKP